MASSGQRDRLVTIQELAAEPTGESGFPLEEWTDLDTEWMQKSDVSMREQFQGDQLSAAFDSEWEMPFRDDMDPEQVDVPKTRRLVYGTRVHDIVGAEQIRRRAGIKLRTLAGARVS